jgi:hypothetical protein
MTRRSISRRPDRSGRRRALAVGAVLATTLVAGCAASVSPSASTAPIPPSPSSPSTSSSESPDGACTAADIRASASPWDGAAGSRFSEVVVENSGGGTCSVSPNPVVALVDQVGEVIAQSAPSVAGAGPAMPPGGRLGFTVQLGNWCQAATPPVAVQLVLGDDRVMIDGLTTTSSQLPPCNAPGQPPTISATAWVQP